ncbi:glycosyltransferase [Bacillus lacus]|uniref:Glycosyltransferase n=1 Tax=Metabacillus lacus TaxID=1983721 RepID=A0A7X2M158_9BACI|nr:glycosyltransferase family 4 protein [Metabacillus lacus]MRX74257.1 glycosyltransferase [Metabacillus lacus]
MNILFVYYLPSGGVETLNRQRSSALQKRGIHPDFLYYRKERELVNDHGAEVLITANDAEIQEFILRKNYAAVIVTSDYLFMPKLRSWGYQGPVILEIQGLGSMEQARHQLLSAQPYVAGYGSGILSSKTPHIIELLKELYPATPTYIINNCFDETSFQYQVGSAPSSPVAAWIGRLEDNKNWREFLLIGHRLINEYNRNLQLWMYEDHTLSSPAERAAFQSLVVQLGIQQQLTVHSNIPHREMNKHFSRIGDSGGFLCSTSKVEGFGYAIVEAMSCYCPVLSTHSDGVSLSVIHNTTGKYYTLGNIDEAVKESVELMSNASLRKSIREKAYQHIQTAFSPAQYAEDFFEMVKSCNEDSN